MNWSLKDLRETQQAIEFLLQEEQRILRDLIKDQRDKKSHQQEDQYELDLQDAILKLLEINRALTEIKNVGKDLSSEDMSDLSPERNWPRSFTRTFAPLRGVEALKIVDIMFDVNAVNSDNSEFENAIMSKSQ